MIDTNGKELQVGGKYTLAAQLKDLSFRMKRIRIVALSDKGITFNRWIESKQAYSSATIFVAMSYFFDISFTEC